MPWTVRRLEDLPQVLELTFSSTVDRQSLTQAVKEAFALTRQHGISRVLTDCTRLEGGHSLSDLYFLAESLAPLALGQRLREAVLLPQRADMVQDVRFWETTSQNRGLNVHIFADRDQALSWLLSTGP